MKQFMKEYNDSLKDRKKQEHQETATLMAMLYYKEDELEKTKDMIDALKEINPDTKNSSVQYIVEILIQ